jgi:hypothetical protein
MVGLLALSPFFLGSCLTVTLPKGTSVDTTPTTSGPPKSDLSDNRLIAAWELMYQVNDKGEEERPRETTRATIEFTNEGRVFFNRIDRENENHKKSKTGKYSAEKDEIRITDDAGNTVRWPYSIAGDTLVLVMPEVKKKFYWRKTQK